MHEENREVSVDGAKQVCFKLVSIDLLEAIRITSKWVATMPS